MVFLTISAQLVLPLALLAWVALSPAQRPLLYAVQLLATASVLLALSLVSVWIMPPWWTPYIHGLLFAFIALWHFLRRGPVSLASWSGGLTNGIAITLVALLGLYGASLSYAAIGGRQPPDVETVDIAAPFGPGTYFVAHGGSAEIVNAHLHTLDPSVERFRRWRGQSRGLDIIRIGRFGLRSDGWQPVDPTRYETFGVPILAPCAGTVVLAVDGLPDMPVPVMDRENMAGNHVIVDCSGFAVVLAHFRKGSVAVAKGQSVRRGDRIGEMGNSGNSAEPHLHIHAQRGVPADAPLGGEPLGLTINGAFPVRNDRIVIEDEPAG